MNSEKELIEYEAEAGRLGNVSVLRFWQLSQLFRQYIACTAYMLMNRTSNVHTNPPFFCGMLQAKKVQDCCIAP